jgi:hypothetical protein
LADGYDAGTLDGTLWTPGRLNGVVNEASWEIVPQNKWIQVANTRLDTLESQITSAIPGWRDPSVSKWVGVTEAWNGVAYDERGHRAWWVAAGGHADGANNGIYRFDAFNMAYSIEHMPSDTTKWSESYAKLQTTGTYTFCPESDKVRQELVTNGTSGDENDWFYDELYWDNQPTSRHTYSGALYVPERDELVLAVRRLWRYSISEKRWFYRVLPQGDNAVSALGEESIAYYDQSRDQVLALSCGSGGPWSNTFNMSNNKWTGENVIGHGWDWSGAADYRHNNTVTLFKAVEAEDTYASPGRYVSYDIVTRQVHVSGEVQYGPGVKREDFYPTDGNGMVYIPPLNRYWVVQTNATSRDLTWLELDPTTTPWTYNLLKLDSPTPALTGSTLVRRRMIWLPNLNAIVWLGSADQNVQVYKIGDYTPFTPYYVPIDRAPIAGPQSSNPSSQQSPSSQPPSSSVTNSATPVQFSVGLLISAVFALCSNTLI